MKKHEAFQQFFKWSVAYNRDLFLLPEKTTPYLHLWMLPSFTDACLWTIYYETSYQALRPTENTPYVKEIRRQNHYKNGYRYNQDMAVREAKLDKTIFNELMEEADNIAVPVAIHQLLMGNDGEYNGIERTLVGAIRYRLSWWSMPPKQRQPLVDWSFRMVHYLVETLNRTKSTE